MILSLKSVRIAWSKISLCWRGVFRLDLYCGASSNIKDTCANLCSKPAPWWSNIKGGSLQQPHCQLAAIHMCPASTSRGTDYEPSRTSPHVADPWCASCAMQISFTTPILPRIWTKSMAVRSNTGRESCTSWNSLAADPSQRRRSDSLFRTLRISSSFQDQVPRSTHSHAPRKCPDVKLLVPSASKRISLSTAISWLCLVHRQSLALLRAVQVVLTKRWMLLTSMSHLQRPCSRAVLLSLPS